MAKGENIFKRKDGRWEARYIKGYELSGKIRYGFCYGKSYREAKEKVTSCKAAVANGKMSAETNTHRRFASFCDEWLQQRKLCVKEATYIKYDIALAKYIKPQLGGYIPLHFTTGLLDDFTRFLLLEKGLSPKTARDVLTVLNSVLQCTSRSFGSAFPSLAIHYPKTVQKEMRVLSREEQERFTNCLLDDLDTCKFGVLLALFTGMRIGELCALRWESISVREQTLHVGATMQRLRDVENAGNERTRVVVGAPKTGNAVRTIPLSTLALALCRRMEQANPNAYVLTGTETPMEPRTLQYRMKKYTQSCGLEGVHFHTLRHTFATRAVEVGFEIKSLSEILGHANTRITLDRYVHSSMELKRENMGKLSAVGL